MKMDFTLYRQTTEFTCGPAALLTAMTQQHPAYTPPPYEEFTLWHEANSIFMGEGHPGCGLYGLALSAQRRGFTVSICTNMNNGDSLFADWLPQAYEREVHNWHETQYRIAFLLNAGTEQRRASAQDDVLLALKSGAAVLLLTSEPDARHEGHWVCLFGGPDESVLCFDPYCPPGKSRLKNVSLAWIEQQGVYGADKKIAAIAITRPAT